MHPFCLFVRVSVCLCVQKLAPFPAVRSQNVTNKSCLICVKSQKYPFWVTLSPPGIYEAMSNQATYITFLASWGQARYIKTHFSVSSPHQYRSQAVVFISITRMNPRSGYFLVFWYFDLLICAKVGKERKCPMMAFRDSQLKTDQYGPPEWKLVEFTAMVGWLFQKVMVKYYFFLLHFWTY